MNGNILKTASTMTTEAVFSKDHKHRYLLHKVWDTSKPKAAIILLYPGYSDALVSDTTTMLTVNQIATLGFGSVDVLNIFSLIGGKNMLTDSKSATDRTNDEYIMSAAKEADHVIIATGRGNNKTVDERAKQVIALLEPYKDKLYSISDGKNAGYHPLSPKIRYRWILEPLITTDQQRTSKE